MEEIGAILKLIKDLWDFFGMIGYDPIPTMVATAILFIARERFVRPIHNRKMKKVDAIILHAKMKDQILKASWLFSFITAFAIKRSIDPFDILLILVWSVIHTAVASMLYSYFSTKNFMKKLGGFVQPKE